MNFAYNIAGWSSESRILGDSEGNEEDVCLPDGERAEVL